MPMNLYERTMHNLTLHAPQHEAVEMAMDDVRDAFKKCAETMIECAPESRELSEALTHFEAACMWTIAAIARNQQEVVNSIVGEPVDLHDMVGEGEEEDEDEEE